MIDSRWTRYVNASITKYFTANKGPYHLWVEGMKIPSGTKAELRINGPTISEAPKNQFQFEVEISLMLSHLEDANIYSIDSMIGHYQSVAYKEIFVYKLGSGEGEWSGIGPGTGYILGCLTLRKDVPRPVDVIRWGHRDPETKLLMASIDAYYEMGLIL